MLDIPLRDFAVFRGRRINPPPGHSLGRSHSSKGAAEVRRSDSIPAVPLSWGRLNPVDR